jgi:uncharacterized protein (TIGR02996 family)
MHDEAARLAAVRGHPEDDATRLVYADWLEEHGQADRANFIRLHIAWCRRQPDDPPDDLQVRLLAGWEAAGLKGDHQVYDRGFVAVAEFEDFEGFVGRAAEVFARDPVRVMYLYQYFSYEDEIGPRERFRQGAGLLSGLVGLGCSSCCWLPGELRGGLALPELAGLQVLDFYGAYHHSHNAAEAIAAATHLTELRVLDLSGNCRGDQGLLALAGARHLRSLTSLRLGADDVDGENDLTEEGIVALTRSRSLVHLTQLGLDYNRCIGDEGLAVLLTWKYIGRLEELDLRCTGLSENGLLALARSRKLVNLRRLAVDKNEVTPRVAEALLRSAGLRQLRHLRLFSDPLEDGLEPDLVERLWERFGRFAVGGDDELPVSWVCEADRLCARARRAQADYHDQHPEHRVL